MTACPVSEEDLKKLSQSQKEDVLASPVDLQVIFAKLFIQRNADINAWSQKFEKQNKEFCKRFNEQKKIIEEIENVQNMDELAAFKAAYKKNPDTYNTLKSSFDVMQSDMQEIAERIDVNETDSSNLRADLAQNQATIADALEKCEKLQELYSSLENKIVEEGFVITKKYGEKSDKLLDDENREPTPKSAYRSVFHDRNSRKNSRRESIEEPKKPLTPKEETRSPCVSNKLSEFNVKRDLKKMTLEKYKGVSDQRSPRKFLDQFEARYEGSDYEMFLLFNESLDESCKYLITGLTMNASWATIKNYFLENSWNMSAQFKEISRFHEENFNTRHSSAIQYLEYWYNRLSDIAGYTVSNVLNMILQKMPNYAKFGIAHEDMYDYFKVLSIVRTNETNHLLHSKNNNTDFSNKKPFSKKQSTPLNEIGEPANQNKPPGRQNNWFQNKKKDSGPSPKQTTTNTTSQQTGNEQSR